MKRILITGSAGFVGSHLVEHLVANTNWHIIGLDSFRHRGDSLRIYQDPKRYDVYCHDLTAPISDRLAAKIGRVDYIINVASESHVDRSIIDPIPFVENNVKLVLNILEYARVAKPKAFIQISTDEVYGPALGDQLHKEWETYYPSNPYSAGKAAQESICFSYWRSYNLPIIITNTMNMIGERQDKEKYLPKCIIMINKGEKVPVHGTEDYIGKRFYLHARNHADALLFLLRETTPTIYRDSKSELIKLDKYNVVGEVEVDNLTLAQTVADLMGKELKYKFVDFHSVRPGHDRRYALDGSKIKELGWEAPVSFKESLERTIKWTLSHKEWLL